MLDIEVDKHIIFVSKFENKLRQIKGLLKVYTGENCSLSLPELKISFFDPSSLPQKFISSYAMKLLEQDLFKAKKEFNLEKSRAYPNIKIGPSSLHVESNGQIQNMYGLSLSVPLPVLNRNQGGIAAAKMRERLFLEKLHYKKREDVTKMQLMIERYQSVYKDLKTITATKELRKRHHTLDQLFTQGRVQISTVREAHDQLLGFIEMRNNLELEALGLMFDIYQNQNQHAHLLDRIGVNLKEQHE